MNVIFFIFRFSMKYYLSSFRLGDFGSKLAELAGGGPLAYVGNALDHIEPAEQETAQQRNVTALQEFGIRLESFDLRDFFSCPSRTAEALNDFSGVWINGGNTFVLRQAMKLSGFDKAIKELSSTSFLYAGFSAGICVLAPDLRALQIVDKPNIFPYPQQEEVIWEGLNMLDYIILPHYKSDHPESADIDREVEFCQVNDISYRTLRDGEVLFGDNIEVIKRGIGLNP